MMIAVVVVTAEVDVEEWVAVLAALAFTLVLEEAVLIEATGFQFVRKLPAVVASTRSSFIAFLARSVSVALFLVVLALLPAGVTATIVEVIKLLDDTDGGDETKEAPAACSRLAQFGAVGDVGDLIERSKSIDF